MLQVIIILFKGFYPNNVPAANIPTHINNYPRFNEINKANENYLRPDDQFMAHNSQYKHDQDNNFNPRSSNSNESIESTTEYNNELMTEEPIQVKKNNNFDVNNSKDLDNQYDNIDQIQKMKKELELLKGNYLKNN